MASAGNWFETERKAYDLRTKSLLSSVATYTASCLLYTSPSPRD